jgi:hypothetical protein
LSERVELAKAGPEKSGNPGMPGKMEKADK